MWLEWADESFVKERIKWERNIKLKKENSEPQGFRIFKKLSILWFI